MLDMNEKLLTVKEVLEMAKVSRYTLYRDIRAEKVPAVYLGKNIRIKESDAIAYAKMKGQSKWVAYYKKKEA